MALLVQAVSYCSYHGSVVQGVRTYVAFSGGSKMPDGF